MIERDAHWNPLLGSYLRAVRANPARSKSPGSRAAPRVTFLTQNLRRLFRSMRLIRVG
jgi:hypothetical protein